MALSVSVSLRLLSPVRLHGLSTLYSSRLFEQYNHSTEWDLYRHLHQSTMTHYQLNLRNSNIASSYMFGVTGLKHSLDSPSVNVPSYNFKLMRQYSSKAIDEAEGQLVYEGQISKMLRLLKLFSLTTSTIGLCVQPYMFFTYQDMPLAAAVPMFVALNVFVFVNPILIHYVAKKYVTELHFNPITKVFNASLLTFFARKEKLSFTQADVEIPDVPNMFTMLNVKGRPIFVLEQDFTDMEVYKHLMKFDQPLDLTYLDLNKEDKK